MPSRTKSTHSPLSRHRFTSGKNNFLSTSRPASSAAACSPAHAHIELHGTHSHAAHLCGSMAYRQRVSLAQQQSRM
jgi:hypothetical protein